MALAACALLAACGGSAPAAVPTPTTGAREIPAGAVSSALLTQWPEFGIDPQRSDVSPLSTGITRADIGRLRRITVHLPGTIDSSAIYLHDVSAGGSIRDVVIATSTYGRTFAIDAGSGALLWTFTPAGYSGWAGSSQITTATPVADPAGGWVYAASPDGRIHKLAISDGREASGGSWPVLITRDATHEKITAALNVDGPDVIATTGGYIGDTPPYQGHLVLISRATGVEPYFVGKPNPLMVREGLNTLGAHSETTVMVGDRMDTDMVAGIEAGLETILVLSGMTGADEVDRFPYRPSRIVDSVADLVDELRRPVD